MHKRNIGDGSIYPLKSEKPNLKLYIPMKKKTLNITLLDGRTIERDITLNDVKAPLGAPANDQAYALLCQSICMGGYTDVANTNETQYTHIAPSQIKHVQVKFE